MEFLHASIALLASMVLVLAGMVGWLYWQQTRLFQNMNSIVMIISELARPPPPIMMEETEVQPTTTEEVPAVKTPVEEDDRVSVEEDDEETPAPVQTIDGPPEPIDTDSLEGKTTKELKDMLTKRGIPYGKRDSKNILISLLKATA
jgi:hypothetical protein